MFILRVLNVDKFSPANGDIIVTLLPVNTKWPWITPAVFRPELVPEELMAQGLTVCIFNPFYSMILTNHDVVPPRRRLVDRRRVRARHGNAGQRLPLHAVQHLLQAHPLLLDHFRLLRTDGPAVLRPERHRTVQPGRRLAVPERFGYLPVHVAKVATVARPGALHCRGQQAAAAPQDHRGAGRSRSDLVPQGEPVLHVLRAGALCEVLERLYCAQRAERCAH